MSMALIVCGAGGRMGGRIITAALVDRHFKLVGAVEKAGHPQIGHDAGITAGVSELGLCISDELPPGADIVIDFSLPEAAPTTACYCAEHKAALVMGTTGLGPEQHDAVKAASRDVPIIYGTNMSVGMNVLFSMVGKFAAALGEDYDIEIVEQHHRYKKDSPSGTALTLAERICRATQRPYPDSLKHGREGKDCQRLKGEVGMHAVRAGDITGVHTVMFSAVGETVTLNHTAHSRDTFARGAIRAAKWLVGKDPGLYSMADVLGIT